MKKKILTAILGSTLLSSPAISMDTGEGEISHSPRRQTPEDAKVTLANHLNGSVLEKSINDLNEGKKGVCFMPLNFSQNEKNFLERLEVRLPENSPFGKGIDSGGSIFFTEEEKLSEHSPFNRVKSDLNLFFNQYTNATELENYHGIINGPEFLAKVILEYCEKLLDKVNASQKNQEKNNCVFISIKAFKPNDAFLNFHRWHYDGNIHSEAADLNFAGALTGAPTVFAATAEENIDILFHKVKKISEETRNNTYSAQEMVEGLTLIRDRHQQNTIEYENINKEIDTVKKLEMSNESNKQEIFRRLQVRMNLQALENENLIFGVTQPKPHEIALFTMNGKKPALHSEPNIDVPRIFFGLRVYQDIKEDPVSTFIRDLPDPRTF